MYTPLRAVVIGYDPVGAWRANMLAEAGYRVTIVCATPSLQVRAEADHPLAWVAGSAEELDSGGYLWRDCLAVITSPAATHCRIFHELATYGVRRMLFEEPIAASAKEAAGMARRAAREGISLGVNCTRLVNLPVQRSAKIRMLAPHGRIESMGSAANRYCKDGLLRLEWVVRL